MHTSTKLLAVGAIGAAAYGATRMIRRRARPAHVDSRFDASDVRDVHDVTDASDVAIPMIITEEIIVITDADVDYALISEDDL